MELEEAGMDRLTRHNALLTNGDNFPITNNGFNY